MLNSVTLKRFGFVLGIIGALLLVIVILPAVLLGLILRPTYPAQPTFGYTGEWRTPDVFGFEEKNLIDNTRQGG